MNTEHIIATILLFVIFIWIIRKMDKKTKENEPKTNSNSPNSSLLIR